MMEYIVRASPPKTVTHLPEVNTSSELGIRNIQKQEMCALM
jgi:hypothetical protein